MAITRFFLILIVAPSTVAAFRVPTYTGIPCPREPQYGEYCDFYGRVQMCQVCSEMTLYHEHVAHPEECKRITQDCRMRCPKGVNNWPPAPREICSRPPTTTPEPTTTELASTIPPAQIEQNLNDIVHAMMEHYPGKKCPIGYYWNEDYVECKRCSACPDSVIQGTSQHWGSMYECHTSQTCPNFCTEVTATQTRHAPQANYDAIPRLHFVYLIVGGDKINYVVFKFHV